MRDISEPEASLRIQHAYLVYDLRQRCLEGRPMKLLVINPNTTDSMTRTIGASARAAAGPGTEVIAVSSPTGPASIESHYDEALAVPGLLTAIRDHPAD